MTKQFESGERSLKGLRGRELYRVLVKSQQRWIEYCEAQPKGSYYGENGLAVRRADRDELERLERLAK